MLSCAIQCHKLFCCILAKNFAFTTKLCGYSVANFNYSKSAFIIISKMLMLLIIMKLLFQGENKKSALVIYYVFVKEAPTIVSWWCSWIYDVTLKLSLLNNYDKIDLRANLFNERNCNNGCCYVNVILVIEDQMLWFRCI